MFEIKISVVIAVYNSEKYIRKCLDSILSQSLKEIEIIVVNDGSKDDTYKILSLYQDKRLVLIHQKNLGVSMARNNALKKAKGKYIIFIDSDDWIEPGYFEEMFNRAESEGLDLVITDYYYDKGHESKYIKDLSIEDKQIISREEYLEYLFSEELNGFNWNKLIKRSLLDENGICYDNKVNMMEDLLLLIKISYFVKKVGKINKAFYHYIQHKSNITNQVKIKHLNSIERVFEEIKNQKFIAQNLKKKIEKKEIQFLCWSLFNLTEKLEEDYFLYNHKNKLNRLKFNESNLSIILIKLFPNKVTIKIIQKIYLIKNLVKGFR